MIHARNNSVILGNKSHIYIYEQGGISNLGNVFPRVVNNLPDGSMDIDEIKS